MNKPITDTSKQYAETAKRLGIKYRIGKYGVELFPNKLGGGQKRLLLFLTAGEER